MCAKLYKTFIGIIVFLLIGNSICQAQKNDPMIIKKDKNKIIKVFLFESVTFVDNKRIFTLNLQDLEVKNKKRDDELTEFLKRDDEKDDITYLIYFYDQEKQNDTLAKLLAFPQIKFVKFIDVNHTFPGK